VKSAVTLREFAPVTLDRVAPVVAGGGRGGHLDASEVNNA
jgi:hypothetical protein